MPTCAQCNCYLGNSAAVVYHVVSRKRRVSDIFVLLPDFNVICLMIFSTACTQEEKHGIHVKLNATSSHVAYCQDCHKYIGKNKPGQESRKALEKHLHKKHEVDILE